MKKFTLFFSLILMAALLKAQQGLEGVVVEKYYLTDAADSTDAADNGAVTVLHKGSVTYRVFLDIAPGYEFSQIFGNSDALGNILHPLVIKTTTDFYNDASYGQVYPQGNSVNNTKKNTTLIDSWLTVGGVCAGKMGVLKTEDTDGSIGNSSGVLANNPGGSYGVAINSVVTGAQDGLMPGTPLAPTVLGIGTAADVFDQTAGNTFSVTNGSIAGLGGVVGVTPSNMVLIGQFTTDGALSFSLNVQLTNTLTNTGEVYVPNNPQTGEFVFPALAYSTPGTTVGIEEFGSATNELPSITIYPNPSKDVVIISANKVKESASNSYSIYDVAGRMILARGLEKASGNFSETVNISGLTKGVYFINVSLGGLTTSKKIVKE